MTATLIAGIFTAVVGAVIAMFGMAIIEVGAGGYGTGTFPMVRVPTDWFEIALGVAVAVVGVLLISVGLHAAGVGV